MLDKLNSLHGTVHLNSRKFYKSSASLDILGLIRSTRVFVRAEVQ